MIYDGINFVSIFRIYEEYFFNSTSCFNNIERASSLK